LENKFEHIEDLIAKYLTEEATEAEKGLVREWIGVSDENKKYFSDAKLIFDASINVNKQQAVNVESAWSKLQQKFDNKKENETPVIKFHRSSYFKI
jgi:hypothetical protein